MTFAPPSKQSTLAVVIPAYNAEATLPDCLSALAESDRVPDEIILFDDGSSDRTAMIARATGATVLQGGSAGKGPAIGRNIGAAAASADTIVFVDADVAVHPDALAKLEAPLISGEADATFGSYDDEPRSRRLAAIYANLRHHWVHQNGRREAFTFWSGLGAIRSDSFAAVNGFDPRFREPSIEDIDLGIRLIESGREIRLIKDALGTHCKDWGLIQLWKTDVLRRAIPWARLMSEGRGRANDLNISNRERVSAVAANLVWVAALLAILRPISWVGCAIAAAGYLTLNAPLLGFIYRSAGLPAAIAGAILHWCYYVYATATYVVVTLVSRSLAMRSRIMTASAGRTQATRP